MSVRIHIPPPMRSHADGLAVVEVDAASVQGALDELGKRCPAITARIFEGGRVRRFVNVCVNNEDVRYLDDLATAVRDGDDVSIIPATAGG
jgi:molybdopterin converting factor small subunit